MKQLFLLLNCGLIMNEAQSVTFIEYDPVYKKEMIEIAFQEKEKLFIGYANLKRIPKRFIERIDSENRKGLEDSCDNLNIRKKLLIDNGKLAGYVIYMKLREPSLESLERSHQENLQKMPKAVRSRMPQHLDASQMKTVMPHIKNLDSECQEYIKLDTIVVSTEFRRKGHGEKLLRAAIDDAQQRWPGVTTMKLTVNDNNVAAMSLYKKLGFVEDGAFEMMQSVNYKKTLVSSKL